MSSTPSPETNKSEELRSLVQALLENQAKDHQLMQELLQGQKDLKTRLDEVNTKCGRFQDKLKARNHTIASIHSDVRAVASQVDALKKEVKQSASTVELTTVRSRLDEGLAKMTTRLAEIQTDLGSLKDAPSASTSAPVYQRLPRRPWPDKRRSWRPSAASWRKSRPKWKVNSPPPGMSLITAASRWRGYHINIGASGHCLGRCTTDSARACSCTTTGQRTPSTLGRTHVVWCVKTQPSATWTCECKHVM